MTFSDYVKDNKLTLRRLRLWDLSIYLESDMKRALQHLKLNNPKAFINMIRVWGQSHHVWDVFGLTVMFPKVPLKWNPYL